MQTTDNIIFDDNLYRSATHWTFLLYEQNGVSLTIPLPNADLMSFIKPFNNISQCQEFVETNLRKIITLFVWDENIQQWLTDAPSIPISLHEIKIFCNSCDRSFVNASIRRHMHRFKNTTFEIITDDKLNYDLMLFGVGHLKKLFTDFQPNSSPYRKLILNYKRLCRALANYFWDEANVE
ncbi:unnamed protein product [Adineta steineri]|uniref:Uncharacterized protein n=1 Tax=Adineta steineri TaxID=433720 RepID=A0A813SLE9_9BILA|nr:unnamed protein product [Adineta steineri]CAF3999106.1 unnamed protein product [Adineta steineri]